MDNGRRGHEISVKDGDELACCAPHSLGQCSGLESFAMVTVMIRDRTTGARVFTHKPGRHDPSVVR